MSFFLDIFFPARYWAKDSLGIVIPFCLCDHQARPEQSKPVFGDRPPKQYFFPICDLAVFNICFPSAGPDFPFGALAHPPKRKRTTERAHNDGKSA